ncbi:MAG: hypothetical protein QM537_04150 [Candidatus Symbiobacter sp.]|nr:hypothetical protein [Candidatus Symbiobacter sp.]
MQLIKKIFEPNRLFLVWQKLEVLADQKRPAGKRYKIAEITKNDNKIFSFKYLSSTPSFADAKKSGFDDYPAFKIQAEPFIGETVLSAFNNRIFNQKRRDLSDFLTYWGIAPDVKISDFALLGYSGGELPSDNFTFVVDYDRAELPLEIPTLVVGVRYFLDQNADFKQNIYGDNKKIADDVLDSMKISLIPEPENQDDPMAIKVVMERPWPGKLGYINRVLAEQVTPWLKDRKVATDVLRVNGTPESPNILLKLTVM